MNFGKMKIAFADLTHTGVGVSANSFPLGVGYVAAYAKELLGIEPHLFKYPQKLDQLLPTGEYSILACSNYSWNTNLSYEFAKRFQGQVIFGGPDFPLELPKQGKWFLDHPKVEFINGEGEARFVEFLDRGTFTRTRLEDINEIPSPYLTGMFDKFFDDHLIPLVQTTRGCPFRCTFCKEGVHYWNEVRRFDMDRVKAELEYIAKRAKLPHLIIADSNFGMYKQDVETCEFIAKLRERYNWPKYIDCSTGKGNKEQVLECARILKGRMTLSASLQTTNEQIAINVNRKNVDYDQVLQISRLGEEYGANTLGEVILNLPGDTVESYTKSICDMVDAGLSVVRSFQLLPLPGATISKNSQREKYGLIGMFRVIARCFGEYDILLKKVAVAEVEEVCVGSNTMTLANHIKCRLLGLTVEAFHNNGVFSELVGLLKRRGVKESDWILAVHAKALEHPVISKVYESFRARTENDLCYSPKIAQNRFQMDTIRRKYMSGEMGNNESFRHRGLLVFNLTEPMHMIAFAEAEALLGNKVSKDHLKDIYCVSMARRARLLEGGKFRVKTLTDMTTVLNAPCPPGTSLIIEHTPSQKELMESYISQFGKTADGYGRILHKTFVNKLYRQVNVT